MTDPKRPHTADKTPRDTPDRGAKMNKAKEVNSDLDEALEESFPASDPPSQTQPETSVGTPGDHKKK